MSTSQILKLTTDSYKTHVFKGFARLQEQQVFVDLTLAAEGHLVKVHKSLLALASPYFKEMLQLAPSKNPVIFLNNVSHKVLCYLLEYIYQGEVCVPEDSLQSFVQVAKALHIHGVNDDCIPEKNNITNQTQANQIEENSLCDAPQAPQPQPENDIVVPSHSNENFAALITINSNHNLEVQHMPNNLPQQNQENTEGGKGPHIVIDTGLILPSNMPNNQVDCSDGETNEMVVDTSLTEYPSTNTLTTQQEIQIDPTINRQTVQKPVILSNKRITLDKEASDALRSISQYSISERGSAQIIVSRFIYYSHHNSKKGRKHRWRCMDYRKLKCPAYIDSFDGVITARKGLHIHSFHDEKIYKKRKDKLIFASIKQVHEARESSKHNKAHTMELSDLESDININVIPKHE